MEGGILAAHLPLGHNLMRERDYPAYKFGAVNNQGGRKKQEREQRKTRRERSVSDRSKNKVQMSTSETMMITNDSHINPFGLR